MLRLTIVEHDGTRHDLEAEEGTSIRQVAMDHKVPGIRGDCGGCATCGTCHGYIEATYLAELDPIEEEEEYTLTGVPAPVLPTSRLTCQVFLTKAMDGVTITLPKDQY